MIIGTLRPARFGSAVARIVLSVLAVIGGHAPCQIQARLDRLVSNRQHYQFSSLGDGTHEEVR